MSIFSNIPILSRVGPLLFLLAGLYLLPPQVYSGPLNDPGIPDTVRVDTAQGFRGGVAIVPVRMFTDQLLGGVTLVFDFSPSEFVLDSFSFIGGVAEALPGKNVRIDSATGMVDIAAFTLDENNAIQPGSALLGKLYFSVDPQAAVGVYPIDTTTLDPPGPAVLQTSFSTLQQDTLVNETIFPQFVRGAISVPTRPATNDSLWISSVLTGPTLGFTVDVNLKNEASFVALTIPLTYSSPALTLDSVIFDGTRGILAGKSRQSQRLDDSLQVLIKLEYFDTSPLTPGSGPIARLKFTVADTASNQLVPIDTAAFLGISALQVTTSQAEGGFTFVPQFSPGEVTIDIATDVNDESDQATLPTEFSLEQNHPNPFNPTTTISYALPKASHVRLDVYNVLGQLVTTLVDGTQGAGAHEVEFAGVADNGERVSSGVYFYRLTAESFTQSRKMILLK